MTTREMEQAKTDDACSVPAQLMQQVAAIYDCCRAQHGSSPAEEGSATAAMEADEMAEALLALGHSVTVRTALGGGGGGECLRNLRHVFLSVRLQVRGWGRSAETHPMLLPFMLCQAHAPSYAVEQQRPQLGPRLCLKALCAADTTATPSGCCSAW